MFNYAERFERNPGICAGQTVVRGTRVLLRTILASLAEGDSFTQILKDFPSLTEEDLRAVVAFAAASAEDDMPYLSTWPDHEDKT